jgi:arabinan endo-1,5-alpha-L-arabinosidase
MPALRPNRLISALTIPLAIAATGQFANAATSGANGTHDPSRMIESDGRLYVYSTGGGSKSSSDGLAWTNGPGLFAGGSIPQSTTAVVSSNEGVWAPDVIHLNGLYYAYYSIANAQNACAVGLVTSPTLNPSAANYKWTDRGVIVSNTSSADYCTIDPAPFLDATGNLWLSWGSNYTHPATDNAIFITRLDNTTGLPSSADSTKPGHPVQTGHIEASYVYYHGGYYYLFWNSGGCCDGATSTYLIHVARSQSVTGPYSGAKSFYGSTGSIHGPGHIGIYDECGASRFTYHYYPDSGGSVLGENELSWSADGWPVVGAQSTTPIKVCTPAGSGGSGGSAGTAGSPGAAGAGGAIAQGGAAGSSNGTGGTSGGGISGGGISSGGAAVSGSGGEPTEIAGAPGAGGTSASGPQTAGAGGALGALAGSPSSAGTGVAAAGTPSSGSGDTSNTSDDGGCSFTARRAVGSNGAVSGILMIGVVLQGMRRRRRNRKERARIAR